MNYETYETLLLDAQKRLRQAHTRGAHQAAAEAAIQIQKLHAQWRAEHPEPTP